MMHGPVYIRLYTCVCSYNTGASNYEAANSLSDGACLNYVDSYTGLTQLQTMKTR